MNIIYHFLVNTTSAAGRKGNVWNNILKPEMTRQGKMFRVQFPSSRQDAISYVQKLQQDIEGPIYLVIVGGDGTFNAALNGMIDFDRLHIGYIPTGSGNDLGYSLGISDDPLQALRRILDVTEERKMDIGEAIFYNEDGMDRKKQYFAISSGVGLDAQVCRCVQNSKLKKLLNVIHMGRLVYLFNTVKIILSYPLGTGTLTFRDGEEILEREVGNLYFLAAMNQCCEGGHLKMATEATAFDGKLSFSYAHDISPRVLVFPALIKLIAGKHDGTKGVEIIDADAIEMQLSPALEVHTDGEVWGHYEHVRIRCLPHKIKMMI